MSDRTGPFAHLMQAIEPRDDAPPREDEAAPGGLLPAWFQFSAHSLQDYYDCARRFQLRYVLDQPWPAPPAEPFEAYERLTEQGREFHLLVQRHTAGISEEKLRPQRAPLVDWWDAYLHVPPPDLPTEVRRAEVKLSAPLGTRRLMARFDLVAMTPGERIVIVDWKTALRRPRREDLARRLQTHVYPYVMAEAGEALFGGPLEPDQVTLVYWFTAAPTEPEIFRYNAALHAESRGILYDLAGEILSRDEQEVWPLTPDEDHCRYCVYRSLCDRGVRAGSLYDDDAADLDLDPVEIDFDLDDIDAIAF